jgi:hypothetical protein
MKDIIRRGVERQVAEGMFERAQERMQHQFQQLKVFILQPQLESHSREAPGEIGEVGVKGGRNSRHLGPS